MSERDFTPNNVEKQEFTNHGLHKECKCKVHFVGGFRKILKLNQIKQNGGICFPHLTFYRFIGILISNGNYSIVFEKCNRLHKHLIYCYC